MPAVKMESGENRYGINREAYSLARYQMSDTTVDGV